MKIKKLPKMIAVVVSEKGLQNFLPNMLLQNISDVFLPDELCVLDFDLDFDRPPPLWAKQKLTNNSVRINNTKNFFDEDMFIYNNYINSNKYKANIFTSASFELNGFSVSNIF